MFKKTNYLYFDRMVMKNKSNTFFESRSSNITLTIGLTLLGLMSLISFQYYSNNSTFGQTADELGLPSQFNSTNNSGIANPTASVPNLNQSLTEQQSPPGFVAKGKVNTVITFPAGKWLATGDWDITLNNGDVTSFDTNMTWYNSSGTNAHTHELTNFRPAADDQLLSMKNNDIIIKGVTDVGANNKISWFEVPTTITLNDRRIISISVDDNKTNQHFGGQPILGIIESYEPCSDLPGANMEVLPSCSDLTTAEQSIGLPNDTLAFPPSEGSIPYQGGFPGEQFLPEDQTGGQGGEQFLPEDQTGGGKGDKTPEMNPECIELDIENITANGFETDPSDYHPPSDAIDGDSSTWWSNDEENSWVELNLGQPNTICGLTVEWNKGDTRDYSFKIEVSDDGNSFEEVFEGTNKKGSSMEEIYPIKETDGQYVKLTITSTSSNDGWVSIKEIKAIGIPLP
jgi:hypothetical protein